MKYLESIIDNIDEALFILTLEGVVLFHNEEATQLCNRFGWPPLGMSDNLLSILPKDAGERLTRALSEVIATNEPYRFLNERVSLDGSMVYSELNYIPAIKDNQITHINLLIRDVTVSKIIEKRITNLATELRTLIDSANAIIIATDSQGYITDWNQHTQELTGYLKDDVFAKKIADVLLADQDNSILNNILDCVAESKPVINVEVPVLAKHGENLIFLLNVSARVNASGQVVGAIFVGQDIAERRKIELELKSAQERILFHIENAPLGFIEWDSEFKVKNWTKRTEEILGWSEVEFIASGQTVFNLIYSEDLHLGKNIVEELTSAAVDRNQIQYRNVTKNGRVIWCEWFNSVLKDKVGNVVTIMSLIQDITEKKKIELSLKEAQALAQLGNWELDMSTRQLRWSEEAFRILGFSLNEIEPTLDAYFNVVHPLDREAVRSRINHCIETLTPQSFYHRILQKDVEHNLFIVVQFEFNAKHQPLRLFGTMMDVSTIIEKENKLKQAVKELETYKKSLEKKVEERTNELRDALKKEKNVVEMKSRFVSIASHEFRTPLSTIQYNTNFIKINHKKLSEEDLMDKLQATEKQVKHMMYLLDDVLTYGKSEACKIQLVVTRVKLVDFVERIIEDVGHSTKNTHAIKFKGTNLSYEINIDEKLLRNVLINLLTNAIKYSPGKNLITLNVKEVGGRLIFIIADTGMGIVPEEMDKIFEAFVRGKSTENIQGTGLGLSIVKKAVELLDGTINVESQVGQGTTISVAIPIIT